MNPEELKKISDEELVKKVQNGKDDFFAELVSRYEGRIMNYVRRFLRNKEDAEDLTRGVFLKVYQNVQSFDTGLRFSPWIYRIAHNEAINSIKKKVKEPFNFFDPELIFPHPVAKEDPKDDFERGEVKEMMKECIEKLSDKYKEVLVLRYFEDMDYKDISEVLRIPIATVGVRIKRGKDQLKNIFKEAGYNLS